VGLAADTCTTCTDGSGFIDCDCCGNVECDDCYRGSPYHPLTIECGPDCDGGMMSEAWIERNEPMGDGWQGASMICPKDCDDGRIEVGRVAVTTLAPVVGEQITTDWPEGLEPPYVRVNDGCAFLHSTHHEYERIRVIGEPEPGVMIAILQIETP